MTVITMASFGYLVTRGLFGMAEHISPRLTGRVAFELFCRTPNPTRPSAKEREVIKAAAPFMSEARKHHLQSSYDRFVVHEFRPATPRETWSTALVIHGWRSRTEYMRSVIEALRDHGFRVIAVDLPGHGQSPGRRLHMGKAVAAVHSVAQWFGPFDVAVGHSFGGAVAVNAAVGSVKGIPPVEAGRLVLIATPSSMPAIFEDFGRFLGLGCRTQMAVAAQVERVAGHPFEDYVGARQVAEIGVPILVVHSPEDKEVSSANAVAFAKAGPHVELHWAPKLGHRRILGDPKVMAKVVRFAAGVRAFEAAE